MLVGNTVKYLEKNKKIVVFRKVANFVHSSKR